jgi:hypothetical protein
VRGEVYGIFMAESRTSDEKASSAGKANDERNKRSKSKGDISNEVSKGTFLTRFDKRAILD